MEHRHTLPARRRAAHLSLLIVAAVAAVAPLGAADRKSSLTEAKLLAERGLHLDAARMFGELAADSSRSAEERAKALIHEGVALEAAMKFADATAAYLQVLGVARTEEIVTLLVQAVAKFIPPEGRLHDSWQRIDVAGVDYGGGVPVAVIRWPDDRVPPLELRPGIVQFLNYSGSAPLGEVLERFEPGRRWPHPTAAEITGCSGDARIVQPTGRPVEWEAALRSLVNIYALDADLHDGILTISCGGEESANHEGLDVVELGARIGMTDGDGELDPCSSILETISIPAADAAGLAEVDAMIRRHVTKPLAVRICGIAADLQSITELVGHFESDADRHPEVDLHEVTVVSRGMRFSMSVTVAGGF